MGHACRLLPALAVGIADPDDDAAGPVVHSPQPGRDHVRQLRLYRLMNPPFSNGTGRCVARRTFLRSAGVALALPMLDSMRPALARDPKPDDTPRRFFGVCNNLGLVLDQFFPEGEGSYSKASPFLKLLDRHRA